MLYLLCFIVCVVFAVLHVLCCICCVAFPVVHSMCYISESSCSWLARRSLLGLVLLGARLAGLLLLLVLLHCSCSSPKKTPYALEGVPVWVRSRSHAAVHFINFPRSPPLSHQLLAHMGGALHMVMYIHDSHTSLPTSLCLAHCDVEVLAAPLGTEAPLFRGVRAGPR